MRIENVAHEGIEASARTYEQMSPAQMVAQQMVIRGGIDALQTLAHVGVSTVNVAQMLQDLQLCLHTLHEVAQSRGVILPGYQ